MATFGFYCDQCGEGFIHETGDKDHVFLTHIIHHPYNPGEMELNFCSEACCDKHEAEVKTQMETDPECKKSKKGFSWRLFHKIGARIGYQKRLNFQTLRQEKRNGRKD
jgi:hypothetical protein